MADTKKLMENWIHLGLGSTAIPLTPFTDMGWSKEYSAEHANDGNEGRLVSMYKFNH